MHRLFFLLCHGCEAQIYIPQPTLALQGSNPLAIETVGRRAVFVCNACGLVSSYLDEEILDDLAPVASPFDSGACILCYIDCECERQNCGSPKTIHVVVGATKGIVPSGSLGEPRMRDWKPDPSANCAASHPLKWGNGPYRLFACPSPF